MALEQISIAHGRQDIFKAQRKMTNESESSQREGDGTWFTDGYMTWYVPDDLAAQIADSILKPGTLFGIPLIDESIDRA